MLFVSESGSSHPVQDVWFRVFAVMGTMFLVPGLAVFQTMLVSSKFRNQNLDESTIERSLKRLTASHSAVWLVASILIVYSFQWQVIIRENWQLDRWLLLDELLIIAPVVLSLIGSWAIFFDIQNAFDTTDCKSKMRERFQYVMIRVRVYLLVFLMPLLVGLAAKDILNSQLFNSESIVLLSLFAGFPILLAAFPFMMLAIWQTKKIEGTLKDDLLEICQQHKLRISSLRVWSTSRQIINAVVAGIFPYFRIILISDALVSQFSRSEVTAVLRHEAGHIRRWHLPSRIFFILLPLVIFQLANAMHFNFITSFEMLAGQSYFPPNWVSPVMACGYTIYLTLVLIWLSRQMEYDADLYSITDRQSGSKGKLQVNTKLSEQLSNALLRFVELMPSQLDRRSFWHPTLRKRLIRIEKLKRNPLLAQEYSDEFVHQQFLAFAAILVLTMLTFMFLRMSGY